MFSWEFCQSFKNTIYIENLWRLLFKFWGGDLTRPNSSKNEFSCQLFKKKLNTFQNVLKIYRAFITFPNILIPPFSQLLIQLSDKTKRLEIRVNYFPIKFEKVFKNLVASPNPPSTSSSPNFTLSTRFGSLTPVLWKLSPPVKVHSVILSSGVSAPPWNIGLNPFYQAPTQKKIKIYQTPLYEQPPQNFGELKEIKDFISNNEIRTHLNIEI